MLDVLEFYARMIRSLRAELVLFSALLFFAGLFFAPVVVEREIRSLLWYPLWIWRRVQHWIQPRDPFLKMMALIAFLNATSLLVNILSGLLGFLPFAFAFLVGLHVGVIVMKETAGRSLIGLLLNPVAFLELPATWISLSIGMELGLFQLHHFSLSKGLPFLRHGLIVYGTLILPLLLMAAFVEVLLTKWGLRAVTGTGEGGISDNTDS
jgi:uncharacterized membrane protein SpoIIM required for sporulation